MTTCQSCQNWKPRESGAMARQGFAICGHQPRWTYFSPHHSCGKHEPAPAEIVAKRMTMKGARDADPSR